MRFHMSLPRVEPKVFTLPTVCPYPECRGGYLEPYQKVVKPLKDMMYQFVSAHRYRCMGCGRTFRVYPHGVTQDQTSQQVKSLSVFLYLLGLSYGAVSRILDALGVYTARSSVYAAVQAMVKKLAGSERCMLLTGVCISAPRAEVISVKCKGEWLPLCLSVDDRAGMMLRIDRLTVEDAGTLEVWMEPIAEALDVQFLVTDDAIPLKTVADELALGQGSYKGNVKCRAEMPIDTQR